MDLLHHVFVRQLAMLYQTPPVDTNSERRQRALFPTGRRGVQKNRCNDCRIVFLRLVLLRFTCAVGIVHISFVAGRQPRCFPAACNTLIMFFTYLLFRTFCSLYRIDLITLGCILISPFKQRSDLNTFLTADTH